MKKLLVVLCAGVFLMMATVAMAANTVNVNYNFLNYGYESASGFFSGVDINNDGWLKFSELTNWYTGCDGGVGFAALNDLGDFDYVNNIWIPNARQWNQVTHDAYMTWNNWGYSVATSNNDWNISTTVSTSSQTPIPAAAWLFGSGLIGLAGLRRKFSK